MWLRVSTELDFTNPVATPFILMLRPRSGGQQWVGREQYVLLPNMEAAEYTDPFGNLCQRVMAPAGEFSIRISAEVKCSDESDYGAGAAFIEVQHLPEATLPFLLPSRYCESDRFKQMAANLVVGVLPGYDQVATIVRYIQNTIAYTPGLGDAELSACDVNQRGNAVCRDMAHLGIALTRALAIPARMVVGYLETLQPMDLHAWFEAFVGGRWYTFDPTQVNLFGGRVAIAYGRDAADVAIFTQFGNPVELLRMDIRVERLLQPPI